MTYSREANQDAYPFTLPNLPYAKEALAPFMSQETFEYHHEKHHAAYVTNLNKLIEARADYQGKNLEEVIIASFGKDIAIFNNAAQVWNHSFFWHSMKKHGGEKPLGTLLAAIERDFTSFDKFTEEFKNTAISQFGSGWAWLVSDENGKLTILKTANAETPITNGFRPLICCDVWEHAYYIDYRNKRPDFVASFLKDLVNWDFATYNYDTVL